MLTRLLSGRADFVVWTGQWFVIHHRQLLPEQANSRDGENHYGKSGVVLDSSNTVCVPCEVHQSCQSRPGDGEQGSLLSWVGSDAYTLKLFIQSVLRLRRLKFYNSSSSSLIWKFCISLSDAQRGHALAIEPHAPRLATLRIYVCPCHILLVTSEKSILFFSFHGSINIMLSFCPLHR